MPEYFEITGGTPLSGTIKAAGNKNAVLPMISAALLSSEPVTLSNVPRIADVEVMCEIAYFLGASVSWLDHSTLRIETGAIRPMEIPQHYCRRIRASILFCAPMLARAGISRMHPPGGDVIGRRRIDVYVDGLQQMGASIELASVFEFRSNGRLRGEDIFLREASVTGTEQLLIAAATADGQTILRNAAQEPHVEDLAKLLKKMGADIKGEGTSVITINGVPELHGAEHTVTSDYTEAGSFLALAAATGGSITVTGTDANHYRMLQREMEQLGISIIVEKDHVFLPLQQERLVVPEATGGIPVIDDGPWPHFPSDLMSVMLVLATQVRGTTLFFEKMYESRMYFVDRLIAMGANGVICDPHRVVISGPAFLHSIDLSSPDIRAGIALVSAALCARGTSRIYGIDQIKRGYESIEAKLLELGAQIERKS